MTQTVFPGFGENAPLDGVPDAGSVFARRLADGTLDAFTAAMTGTGYCAHPIRLAGSSLTINPNSGEVLSQYNTANSPLGVLYRACGNRRETVCPACSRVYARDTFEMIRAGVQGGKTVPPTVGENPLLFVTLTAPSFGPVHGTRQKGKGICRPRRNDDRTRCAHGRPTWCNRNHNDASDSAVGLPLCSDCYDYTTHVVWQWHAPELWRRTTIAMRRQIAMTLGVTEKSARARCSMQYARVAEYQARGVVHFHALVRLDGAEGPGSPAPLTGVELRDSIQAGAQSVSLLASPTFEADTARRLAWGAQVDIRVVRQGHRTDDHTGPITPEQVAAYLAKYATKDASTATPRGSAQAARIRSASDDIADQATTRDGWRALGRPTVVPVDPKTDEDPYRRVAKWRHMLAFRGHFSTKSRRYSITLGALRRARSRWRALAAEADRTGQPLDTRDLEARLLADDDDTTLVVGNFTYVDRGWRDATETALALAAAARAREYAQWKRQQNPARQTDCTRGSVE